MLLMKVHQDGIPLIEKIQQNECSDWKKKHSDSCPSVLSSYYYTLPDENSVWLGLQVIGSINTTSQFS